MAVVYSVMLETGFNRTAFGKGILGSCFINDLGTVIALGLLFAPFTYKTVVFVAATVVTCVVLPFTINRMTRIYGHRTAAIRTKLIMVVLLDSARSPTGRAARPSCRPTSWASSWPAAPHRTTTGSGDCAR